MSLLPLWGRISLAVLGTAAAGATLLTPGLGAARASASVGPAGRAAAADPARNLHGPVYSATRAGYEAGYGSGFRFRYIATTFTIPSCDAASARHGWRGNGVELGTESTRWQARILVGCDPGGLSGAPVRFRLLINGRAAGPRSLSLLPQAGDQVSVSIEYARSSGRIRIAATDDSSRDTADRIVTIGGDALFYGAEVGSEFSRLLTPPRRDQRTGDFAGTQLTNYNGRRGTMLGTWPTSQVIATTGGMPYGDINADAPALRDGGSGFSVYQRAR